MAKGSNTGKYAHQTLGTGDFLIRSQIEIKGVLDALAQRQVTITADIGNDSGGFTPFEARITDISVGGMGAMIHDVEINLPAGTVLKNCKIMHPHGDAVFVDVEVRYSVRVMLPDGEWAHRSGFRFLEQSPGLVELIKIFVVDLDQL